MSNIPRVLPDDDGIRPAGEPDECFYCRQKVGTPHKSDCVCLERKVKVRYSYDIEIEVPHSWNKGNIEFHRNDSSWCADNSITEIEQFAKKLNDAGSCLCNCFKCEVLEIPQAEPYRKNDKNQIVP